MRLNAPLQPRRNICGYIVKRSALIESAKGPPSIYRSRLLHRLPGKKLLEKLEPCAVSDGARPGFFAEFHGDAVPGIEGRPTRQSFSVGITRLGEVHPVRHHCCGELAVNWFPRTVQQFEIAEYVG